MAKIKHTKNELKRQRDDLNRFTRYLPTLTLKKQQLQAEVMNIHSEKDKIKIERENLRQSVYKWVDVFGENVNMKELIKIKKIDVFAGNIAGIDIPEFEKVEFEKKAYDVLTMPIWVDYGIEAVKELIILNARYKILEKKLALLIEELRITTQRVNLFEKIKIPEARENIRRISIFLGDLQTASVVTGKIAKRQIEEKEKVLA